MKSLTLMKSLLQAVVLLAAMTVSAQQLQFTQIRATDEGAIHLAWQSESNTVYSIEYTSELTDAGTSWAVLYDDYPSHGTNTFWLDTGNYNLTPEIKHPKKEPVRFYRVASKGTNTAEIPFVKITSHTNGAILSDEVTISVVATSSLPVIRVSLFVDGQEMDTSDDGTNFVINTCEWGNGPHTLFATVTASSAFPGPLDFFPIDIGRAVSAYVPVTFDNLITRVAFSEPFFEPSLGQTQQVTASFAVNVNWTLNIINDESNTVRFASGSGNSLSFDWDGTGTNGVSIPDGVYYYLINAETNGMSSLMSGPSEEEVFSTLIMTEEGDYLPMSKQQALALGMDHYYIQPPPLPPVRTNGTWLSREEVYGPEPLIEIQIPLEAYSLQSAFESDSGGSYMEATSSSPSQSTVTPKRPPTKPVKGTVGTFGVAYYSHMQTNTFQVPRSGLPSPLHRISLEGSTGNRSSFPIPNAATAMNNFINRMKKGAWKLSFNKSDANLPLIDLKRSDAGIGGNNIFSTVNIGYFLDHGSYGTSLDYNSDANQSYQTYFNSSNPSDSSAPWIRMSEFKFTGNMRWMGLLACNAFRSQNYQSMDQQGVLPLGDAHLICSSSSVSWITDDLGELWAKRMLGGAFSSAQKVSDAWFNAARASYAGPLVSPITNTVTLRVVGYEPCFDDKLKSYVNPSPGSDPITYIDQQVFP